MRSIRLGPLLLLLVVVTTLPLAVFAGLLLARSASQQRANVERQNVETARAISVAVDREVESTIASLGVLASLDVLDAPNLDAFRELALRLLPAQPGWRAVVLLDPSGRVLIDTSAPPDEPGAIATTGWLDALVHTGHAVASNQLEDPATRERYVVVAVPSFRAGSLATVVAAEVRSRSLGDILRRQTAPPNGVVTLVDGVPRIIGRTRGEAEYGGGPPSPGFQAALKRMSEGSWRGELLLEGTAAYASLSRSRLTGWAVGIGLPVEEIDAPIRRSFWALGLVGALILASGIATALYLGRQVVVPLAAASRAARALARGEPVSAAPSRVVEVEDLSSALRDAWQILDTRLRERDRARDEHERARLAAEHAHVARTSDAARLAVTLQSIGDAVVTTDAQGRITMLNRVAETLSGWTDAEARGEPLERVLTILDHQTRRPIESPVAAVLRQGSAALADDAVLVARDGRVVPIADSAAPIRAPDGGLLGVVLVFRDVTIQRDAERQRRVLLEQEQAARREAEALSRSKDEFVATVSHELRTPLNAIFGWVRVLQSGRLDDARRAHALEVIERNTRAQSQLIDDLLDMSRMISGKVRLQRREVDLVAVVRAAVDAVRPTAETKEVRLDAALDETLGTVVGDPDRLQQVVWNLLSNSIKFTPRHGRVELRLACEDEQAVLTVQDTGIGIAPTLLPHVFERFRQGESSPSRPHGGLGIGLAIVRHLVELHAGTVEADSPGEGRGATFRVCLPLASVQPGLPTRLPLPSDRSAPNALDRLHVLVVEDDADARDLVATVLRDAGARVTPVGSMGEALEAVRSATPDVLVSDIGMPNGSGYELLRRLRETRDAPEIPSIALTAYARVEDRQHALDAGFDLHVGKPVEPAVLVQTVARAAGR